MLDGWMTTSIREYGTSKRKWASMISKPLFIIVAESTVIFGPIDQLGWCSASSTVMPSKSASGRSRKGPPLAVSTRRRTAAGSSPRRHCHRALCSLSTGISRAPRARARSVTSSPAITSTSLVAMATSVPASRAARVGRRAAAPLIPTQTTSAGTAATSHAAAIPVPQPGGSAAPGGGATTAAWRRRKRSTSADSAITSWPATAPTSSKCSG